MARRRVKSQLDRLVEANRGRGKSLRRKVTKQYLPPEAATAVVDVDFDTASVDDDIAESVSSSLPPNPEQVTDDSSPEELLDDLVRESGNDEGEGEGDPEDSAVSSPPLAVVASEKPVQKPILKADPRFHRPAHAPIRPSTTRPTSQDQIGAGQIVLDIPTPVLQNFASQKKPGQSLREVMLSRLTACQNHTSAKPLYLTDALRRKVEQFAQRDFTSAEEFVGWLISSLDIFIGSEGLTIEPYLIQRAIDRKPPEQTLGEYLSEMLTLGIEIKTGIR